MNTEIKKTIKNEKGFTLVELIVVIAILAILAAVAVPNYVNYKYRSVVSSDISTASEIIRAARIYTIENGAAATASLLASDIPVWQPASAADGSSFSLSGNGNDPSEDSGKYQVSFEAAEAKAGKYKGTYTIKENEVPPKPNGAGNGASSTPSGSSSSSGGNTD